MKDSRVEVASKMVHKMLEDPESYAVSITQIREFSIAEGNSLSASTIERYLRKMYNDGVMEYKKTCKGKSWRFCGTTNPFPPEYNELIFNAVKEINEETGKPATTTQVMGKIGDILDRESVNTRLKKLVYIDRSLLFAGNVEKSGAHMYIVNAEEHKPIMSEIRKRQPKIPSKKSKVEETVERLGGYMLRDIYYARSHTSIGDEFDVYVKKTGLHNNDHEVEKRHLRVTSKQPHICIFEDGTSLPWIDFAALYMNNRRLTQTMY